jgi:catechol 2,3-dioxygenase-like lactoylglutathione lyase family enzyme
MPVDDAVPRWVIRSTLVVVADLDRSVDFYREIGKFEEIDRVDAVAVLGDSPPASILLILREMRSMQTARHGQQSLGLRSITFNVRSQSELDRVESVLRDRDLFTSRRRITDGPSEVVSGRDPDNLPVVFACYADDEAFGADYYRTVANLAYSLDA